MTPVTQRFKPRFIQTNQKLLDEGTLRKELIKLRAYSEELVASLQVNIPEATSTSAVETGGLSLAALSTSINTLATALSLLTARIVALEETDKVRFLFDSGCSGINEVKLFDVGAAFGTFTLDGELTLFGDFYIYG